MIIIPTIMMIIIPTIMMIIIPTIMMMMIIIITITPNHYNNHIDNYNINKNVISNYYTDNSYDINPLQTEDQGNNMNSQELYNDNVICFYNNNVLTEKYLIIPFKEIILNSLHYLIEIIDHIKEEKKEKYNKYKDIIVHCINFLKDKNIISYKEAATIIECKNIDKLNLFNKELYKLITKLKTKNMYSISIYNLINENINGYGKIILLLQNFFTNDPIKIKENNNTKKKKKKILRKLLTK
ncbi:hypothetical protein PFUGPA_00805 [Plasmodium falciparum Palo Alto/Uganda]|uniref:THO complex subunit 2 N-terminal domain-containing protein n=1 Tax=Plasmodium falciparum (isolate Palo Alto / Uganda) TaxID=57270 RepID=W4J6Q2_PLAFP|nr:hypothetical protein PFUGPA_00805 [Plasmodium falciparum Palo Alto/Uganda]